MLPTGERKPVTFTQDVALRFATEAAIAFGVGESKTVDFDKDRARRDVKGESAENGNPSGIISKVTGVKKFTIGKGNKKVEVTIGEDTKYFSGDAESTFEVVVVKESFVEAQVNNGVAVKVSAK